ncbi:MAG: AGE family epimerase/isomerase, partial [Pseudomonadota bacterium]
GQVRAQGDNVKIYPVIMCGGSGTRLWPASTPSRPKQFIPLFGSTSLFAQTVDRVSAIEGVDHLVVIAGAAHRDALATALTVRGDVTVLLEPEGRDSAPAIAAATQWLHRHDPTGIAAVVASDHFIPDHDEFCDAIVRAAQAARAGRIVTMGIVPSTPSSAYGYIRPDMTVVDEHGVRPVAAFVEKPGTETAKRYIDEGYLWNSGNFIFSVETMRDQLGRFNPDILQSAAGAIDHAQPAGSALLLGDQFKAAPKISIDYAVMEKTDLASVLPTPLTWSDLGAWDAVYAVSQKTAEKNAVEGQGVLIDMAGSYLRAAPGMAIAAIGLRDVAIIAEPDAVLVCPLDQAQQVKAAAGQVAKTDPASSIAAPGDQPDLASLKAWFQSWLMTAALPLWATLGIDHQGWGVHESLYQDGSPTGNNRRARVQARQIYCFATMGARGWAGPWQAMVRHGFSGLAATYLRSDGLIRTLVDPAGAICDDTAVLYDQAFHLLALAAAKPLIADAEPQALAILDALDQHFSHPGGGYREMAGHAFQSNPHMHLFEAALAWIDQGGSARWHDLATKIATLCLTNFIDQQGGFLREFFDDKWAPASGEAGTVVEPGHQFEWACLLLRWYRITGETQARQAARRLYRAGQHGIDPARQVGVDMMNDALQPVTQRARLWPQTEWLKAALLLSDIEEGEDRDQLRRAASTAATSLKRYLDTPVRGLWWDRLDAENTFDDEPASGSTFYHLVAAINQLTDSIQ